MSDVFPEFENPALFSLAMPQRRKSRYFRIVEKITQMTARAPCCTLVTYRVFKSPSPTASPGIGESPLIKQILEKKIQNWFAVNTLKYFWNKAKKEYQLAFKINQVLEISLY